MINQQILIAVVNRFNARFLTLVKMPGAGLVLTEHDALVLSAGDSSGAKLLSGENNEQHHVSQRNTHSYDNHHQEHMNDVEHHFAHSIAIHTNQLLQEHHLQSVLLVAAPPILGLMRKTLEPVLSQGVDLTELDKDLCHLTTSEIHEYLAEKNLIPASKRMGLSST